MLSAPVFFGWVQVAECWSLRDLEQKERRMARCGGGTECSEMRRAHAGPVNFQKTPLCAKHADRALCEGAVE